MPTGRIRRFCNVRTGAIAFATLMAFNISAPPLWAADAAAGQSKVAPDLLKNGHCQARRARVGNRCTIVQAHCNPGYLPVAHSPACHCQCAAIPAKPEPRG